MNSEMIRVESVSIASFIRSKSWPVFSANRMASVMSSGGLAETTGRGFCSQASEVCIRRSSSRTEVRY